MKPQPKCVCGHMRGAHHLGVKASGCYLCDCRAFILKDSEESPSGHPAPGLRPMAQAARLLVLLDRIMDAGRDNRDAIIEEMKRDREVFHALLAPDPTESRFGEPPPESKIVPTAWTLLRQARDEIAANDPTDALSIIESYLAKIPPPEATGGAAKEEG